MKKISKLLLGLAVLGTMVFTSCETDDGVTPNTNPSIALQVGGVEGDTTAAPGDTLKLIVRLDNGDKSVETIEFRAEGIAMSSSLILEGESQATVSSATIDLTAGEGTYTYYVIMPSSENPTYEINLFVTDKDDLTASTSFNVNIEEVVTTTALAYENSGAIIGNLIGPSNSAFNLVDNQRETGASPDADMQNPTTVGTVWVKGFDGENSTDFVMDNSFDYDNATVEAASSAYTSGTKVTSVTDIEVGDIFIANLRGGDNYVVIKITSVDDDIADQNTEEIQFTYKKEAETTGQSVSIAVLEVSAL